MDTQQLAKIMLEKGVLNEPGYELRDLFRIRDCLYILYDYGLADVDLLLEVEKYINQKGERR